ncbi:MAG: hypothetical protein ACL93V_15365 [Candidatus Electrothrix sp. YB6]
MKRVLMLCACLFILAGCGGTGGTGGIGGDVELPFTVDLRAGASTRINSDLTIRFVGVTNESRCPTGAQCAWAGNAEVELALSGSGDQVTHLNTGAQYPRTEKYHGYTITLQELKPYPVAGQTISPGSYTAVLVIAQEAPASP